MTNVSDTIAIEELDDAEHLLLWQKAYSYYALQRANEVKATFPELMQLYSVIHSRKIDDYLYDFASLSFSNENKTSDDFGYLYDLDERVPLSIVVTSRNDTHVERMEERTQAFIDCIYFLAEKYKKRLELIIVEWNPPKDRVPMSGAFFFPVSHAYVSTKIVTVPNEVHNRYTWAKTMPMYQMIAKNVGVRRARGKFILATNIDILISEELFEQITSDNLESGYIYRSNRWDVDRKIIDYPDSNQRLNAARGLHFQINYREGIYPKGQVPSAHAKKEHDSILSFENTNLYRLHTEACGDFQMLHRDDWMYVSGYSELDAYSFHLDSLFALTCQHAGLKEKILNGPHYHIDHTLGVKVKSDSYEINEKAVIKHLSLLHLYIFDRLQTNAGDFLVLNDSTWGLAFESLSEVFMTTATWDIDEVRQCSKLLPPTQSSLFELSEMISLTKQMLQNSAFLTDTWSSLSAFIKRYSDKRPVVIWGAGKRGFYTSRRLSEEGIKINYIVHGGYEASPKSSHVLPILSADEFLTNEPGSYFVVIASIYADEIVDVLAENKWIEGQDYIVSI